MTLQTITKTSLGSAFVATLAAFSFSASAAPMITYHGDACMTDNCVDLATAGYTVVGGAVINPATTVYGEYKEPGYDTKNIDTVFSYNVTSSKDNPEGAIDPISVTGLNSAFELYWGSIDSYNSIEFFLGGSTTGFTYTGTDVVNEFTLGGTARNYGTDGYFKFAAEDNFLFDQVILSSNNGVAFEFATAAVPEPATLALIELGFAGLVAGRRRKS